MAILTTPTDELEENIRQYLRERFKELGLVPLVIGLQPPPGPRPRVSTPDIVIVDYADIRRDRK